jgi:HK97 family phage prohead protease
MLIRSSDERPAPHSLARLLTPFALETRSIDTEAGTFSGWASTATLDSWGTILAPGAFDASLAEHANAGTMPALLWQHRWSEVCGRWRKIEKRERGAALGLWCEGAFELATQRGREANALIKPDPLPALNGLSVGFEPDWDAIEWVDDVLVFHKAKLWEISVVTFPANEEARIENARAALDVKTERDLETLLRDAGRSRSEARAIASRFKPLTPAPRDAAPDESDAIAALKALSAVLSPRP